MHTDPSPDGVVEQPPMRLPSPRGPLSAAVVDALAGGATGSLADLARTAVADATAGVAADEDVQLALFCLYELHYGGFESVDDALEWDGGLLAARAVLEHAFEAELRATVTMPEVPEPAGVAEALFALTAPGGGPSVPRHLARSATLEQAREYLVHRTIYTLKEADPHSWAIPRLSGRSKAALVEVQSDEYGGGRPDRVHSAIFTRTVRAAGLDDRYGAYIDHVPGTTLASLNGMSMFGLHRRLRGAIAGHLAAFEMTSSIPNRLIGNGFRRLGFDADATWYFDEHVEADAVHEQIAARDLAGGLAQAQPALAADVLFGAAACLALDDRVAEQQLAAWTRGESSLRLPVPAAAHAA